MNKNKNKMRKKKNLIGPHNMLIIKNKIKNMKFNKNIIKNNKRN